MMEDKTSKPLRTFSNKARDIYDTYIKNEADRKPSTQESDVVEQLVVPNDDSEETIEIHLPESHKKEQEEKIQFQEKIQQLEKEKEDYKDQLQRKAAEFENFRRRTIREKEDLVQYANERLLFNMLPLLDDMEKAIASSFNADDFEALYTGIKMIFQKTIKVFEDTGTKPMDSSVGKPFDVNFHEAILQLPSEQPEGYVIQEVEKGYMIRDKVLRHTKVITSAGENKD